MEGFLSDAHGFFSQICPTCSRRFKVPWVRGPGPSEGGLAELVHCPYCEHTGMDFRTPEQKRYQTSQAARLAIKMLKTGAKLPSLPTLPAEVDDDLRTVAAFACCSGSIRHDGNSPQLFCPFCGKADAATRA